MNAVGAAGPNERVSANRPMHFMSAIHRKSVWATQSVRAVLKSISVRSGVDEWAEPTQKDI